MNGLIPLFPQRRPIRKACFNHSLSRWRKLRILLRSGRRYLLQLAISKRATPVEMTTYQQHLHRSWLLTTLRHLVPIFRRFRQHLPLTMVTLAQRSPLPVRTYHSQTSRHFQVLVKTMVVAQLLQSKKLVKSLLVVIHELTSFATSLLLNTTVYSE